MQKTFTSSDSFIGSLCREDDSIRVRCYQLLYSIDTSKNVKLSKRLQEEYNVLIERMNSLRKTAKSFNKTNFSDSLSLEFLIEISSREPSQAK